MPERGCVLAAVAGEGLRQVRGPRAGAGRPPRLGLPPRLQLLCHVRACGGQSWGGVTGPETEALVPGVWSPLFPCPRCAAGCEGWACVFSLPALKPQQERSLRPSVPHHWGGRPLAGCRGVGLAQGGPARASGGGWTEAAPVRVHLAVSLAAEPTGRPSHRGRGATAGAAGGCKGSARGQRQQGVAGTPHGSQGGHERVWPW